MSSRRPDPGRARRAAPAVPFGATWAWLTVGFLMVATGALVLAGRLAPAIVLDLIALWPVPALAVVILPVAIGRRRQAPLLATIVPLLVLTWLLAGLGWFLVDEVPAAPSRAADITGPDVRPESASLALEVDGHLTLGVTGGALYRIGTSRWGGVAGPPEVYETESEGTFAAVALARSDAGWYLSDGWRLGLRAGPVWTLDLAARKVEVDLRGLDVAAVVLRANGTVWLPTSGVEVTVTGGSLVVVTAGGTVIGEAEVPPGWLATEDGWASPASGPTIVVVEGASVTVEDPTP